MSTTLRCGILCARLTGGVRRIGVVAALLLMLGACSAIPADPDDTLADVTGGTLRVGVSANPPWTEVPEGAGTHANAAGGSSNGTGDEPAGPGSEPEGTEVDLVTAFAATLDAEVEWVIGGEENLIGQLETGEVDLVIGGLTANSPWQQMAALTRPYTDDDGGTGGEQVDRVMAVPAGENAFLSALERFLGQGQAQRGRD